MIDFIEAKKQVVSAFIEKEGYKNMGNWKNRRAWLRALSTPLPEDLKTPLETAAFEAEHFFASRGEKTCLTFETNEKMGETWSFSRTEDGFLIKGGETGILYGTYTLLLSLAASGTSEKETAGLPFAADLVPGKVYSPCYPLRMLNAWDNMSGDIERGYAGRSIWFENNAFSYDPARIRQLGRMLASAGINVLTINNVNVFEPAQELIGSLLPETAAFADLLRPFGVRLMVSIDFSAPIRDGLSSADPLDKDVKEWWKNCADRIWSAIPDFAGFLVKADSEHRPGPATYGRSHAEGANMLARAIAPHGGKLVWRAFVYNCMQDWRDTTTDRPCAAYDLYHPMNGSFDENVILQIKYGPYDFQVREPLSPLLLDMPDTAKAIELQLAQEYTGQQIDIFAMAPMWSEIFGQMGKNNVQAIAAVSNLGRDDCWTGHPFAAFNLYAFGRSGWDPEKLTREWVRLSFALSPSGEDQLTELLLKSRDVYEKYTAPLGLCWMVAPSTHYGVDPWGYEFSVWGTYNRADREGVGIDRTVKGTGFTRQYPEELCRLYEDRESCPDRLLLFFHRLPYSFRMKDGRTLIQRIYDDHFEGYEEVLEMQKTLQNLNLPEEDRKEVEERMEKQRLDAREWCDVVNTFFCRLSGVKEEHGRKIW